MQTIITYKDSGVDIIAGELLVDKIKPLAKRTLRKEVLAGIGGFGALFEIGKKYINPVLVSGTDGVGTKLKLAFVLNKHNTIGIDLVAMSVNDILVQGAEPLFFLDYFACGKLDVAVAADVIDGISLGCQDSGCSLIGGETAEMPSMYPLGEYDLAGFAVGVVEKHNIIDGAMLQKDDVIVGLSSSGLHSNGYSLVRKIIQQLNLNLSSLYDESKTWGEVILAPTRIYVKPVLSLLQKVSIHGMAHITGGGVTGNLARVFPRHLAAQVDLSSLPQTKLFETLQVGANLSRLQMLETFNCGIGYAVIVAKEDVDLVLNHFLEYQVPAQPIGKVINRETSDVVYI